MSGHDHNLATAFDGQAARFEKAPVQTDPAALARLVAFAGLAPGSRLLDAGCGPALVSSAFLAAGHSVFGIDLSAEMIDRARRRCEEYGARAVFEVGSLFDRAVDDKAPFDAAVSRYVLHHVVAPREFLARQASLVRPGGSVILCDHVTDPDHALADRHNGIERLRDTTHTSNLTAGSIVDLFGSVGLVDVQLSEERFHLDFDEWFDRGTPAASKAEVRRMLLESPAGRGFAVTEKGGAVRMDCVRTLVKGTRVD